MKLLLNFFKELPSRKYRTAALCSLGFGLLELWSLYTDHRFNGALHAIVLFSCAFSMVFAPLVLVWTLIEKCRKKEKPITKDTPGENC
jgi:hypothetical protein